MMARFRCGDEKKRENKYWMEGEQRRYRMCYEEREMLEHTWNGCSEMIERERKEREKTPNEGRKGDKMKEICKRRERIEKERGGG
jgi:hypothetical protein